MKATPVVRDDPKQSSRPPLLVFSNIPTSSSVPLAAHSCRLYIHIHPAAQFLPRSMESPARSGDDAAAAAVCCICGDHGLPGELFQCGLCRLRLQHRYCSKLYPREAAYRTCNWCLREEGSGGHNPPVKTMLAVASKPRGLKRSRHDYGDMMSPSYGRCSRTVFSAVPGKPVKKFMKKKGPGRMMEQRPVTTMAAANGRREVQAGAGRKARFRVKVRRYKLLTEVTC